jgi:hypothetical protein
MARYISLLNLNGKYNEALEILSTRHFHAAEASDINLHVHWADAHILRGMELMNLIQPSSLSGYFMTSPADSMPFQSGRKRLPDKKSLSLAIENFTRAMEFPVNLESARDGKIAVALYLRGMARQQSGDTAGARKDYLQLINFESIMGWGTGNWPEVNFCKALAMKKLGMNKESRDIFNNLIRMGKESVIYKPHSASDLSSVQQRHEIIRTRAGGYYQQALGNFGTGNPGISEQLNKRARLMDPSDIGALRYFSGLKEASRE